MPTEPESTETLDARGAVCPIPLARTKGAVDGLETGDVLEVLATEANSLPDFESWADLIDGVELVAQLTEETDAESVYKHYVKKTG